MNEKIILSVALLAACGAGCIQVKTESEIKPIHITMDVNLKVDKELDKAFSDENNAKPQGDFKAVKEMIDRQAAGVTNRGLLEARDSATTDDRILIAEENAKRLKRYNQVAKDSGVELETVQKRRALRTREHLPAGCWYQDDNGTWVQKK